jgi:hypothetical protein
MSDHAVTLNEDRFEPGRHGALTAGFLGAAALGLAGSVAAAFLDAAQFAHSWLFALFYFFTLCAGSLFWILVHHGTDAEWSVMVRRVLETKAVLIWIVALFAIPLFIPLTGFGAKLWHWWSIPEGKDHVLDMKRGYLNLPFFWVRAVFYFVALGTVALLMRNFSAAQDRDGAPIHTVRMRRVAFSGLPLFAVSVSFAAIDWLMGLDHHWFSTMWGVYLFAGAAGSGMALLVVTVTWLRGLGHLKGVTIEHYHIMGKFLLAFTVFWAYIGFSQYMLIWYANIPEETTYFIRRNIGSWNYLSTFLVIFRFFVPFPLLLLQGTKKNPKVLCFVAGWILFMQAIDLYVIVFPMLHHEGIALSWVDFCPLLGMGGVLGFLFLKALGKHNLYPLRDPRVELSAKLLN